MASAVQHPELKYSTPTRSVKSAESVPDQQITRRYSVMCDCGVKQLRSHREAIHVLPLRTSKFQDVSIHDQTRSSIQDRHRTRTCLKGCILKL